MNYDELKPKSFDMEAIYDALVEELKDKLINVIYGYQEEMCLKIEDIIYEI